MKKMKYLWTAACFGVLSLLTGCASEEEMPGAGLPGGTDERAEMVLTLRAGDIGGDEAGEPVHPGMGMGGDQYAFRHEFINHLCLFVVNEEGVIEKKFRPNLDSNEEAKAGNLTGWQSPVFELPAGKKRVYAFANWRTVTAPKQPAGTVESAAQADEASTGAQALAKIIERSEGEKLTETELQQIHIDAASAINIHKNHEQGAVDGLNFIPMSGMAAFELLPNKVNGATVELVRLVSRVHLALANKEAKKISLSGLSFRAFAPLTSLLPDDGYTPERTVTVDHDYVGAGESIEVDAGTSSDTYFYVNETKGKSSNENDRFTIGLTITGESETSGTPYEAQTTVRHLPRNSYYPVILTYSNYELRLDVKAYGAPIGVLPILMVEKSDLTNTFLLDGFPEGAAFTIKASLWEKNSGSDAPVEVSGVTFTWEKKYGGEKFNLYPAETSGTGGDAGTGTLTGAEVYGNLAAMFIPTFNNGDINNANIELKVKKVNSSGQGNGVDLTYYLYLGTVELKDLDHIHLFTKQKGEGKR